jgi:uncharacterized SAM-binding protein YcdF (DUF218 family)
MTDPTIARLFVRHEPRPADLAVVFGYHIPEGAERRARHAATLYLRGLVPRLLFSGGAAGRSDGAAESIRMAGVAVELGVPRQAILIEPASRSTVENAVCSRELLQEGGLLDELGTVILVSCPWHMGGILRIMKNEFLAAIDFLCCPQEEDCTAESWHTCPECRRRVRTEAEFLDALIGAGALPAEV